MIRPLFQLRNTWLSGSKATFIALSSRPSNRSAFIAFGVICTPAPVERHCRGKPGDAAADDRNARDAGHYSCG